MKMCGVFCLVIPADSQSSRSLSGRAYSYPWHFASPRLRN